MRWFGWFRSQDFPLPAERHMELDAMFKYWARLSAKHRSECECLLYRMDPAKAPLTSMLKFRATDEQAARDKKAFGPMPGGPEHMRFVALHQLAPGAEWWATQDPEMERRVYFLARMIRRWRVSGAERHEEICVAGFDVELPDREYLKQHREPCAVCAGIPDADLSLFGHVLECVVCKRAIPYWPPRAHEV